MLWHLRWVAMKLFLFVTLAFQSRSNWLCYFSPGSDPAAMGVDLEHLPRLACPSHSVVAPGALRSRCGMEPAVTPLSLTPDSGHWGHGCEPGWPRAHHRLVGAVGAPNDGHHTKRKEGSLHWGRSHQGGLPGGGNRQAEGDVQGQFWPKPGGGEFRVHLGLEG